MKKTFQLSLVAALILAGVALGAKTNAEAPMSHAPRIRAKNGASTNWSGYAVETDLNNPQNNAVSDVQASWTVPAVTCTSSNAYSSAWIGLDGYSDSTVEQIGTDQDCVNGQANYYAWYEMYPKMSTTIHGHAVNPGDKMTADVQYVTTTNATNTRNKGHNNPHNGGKQSGEFVLTISDVSAGWQFSTTQGGHKAQRQSAEWIVEAPFSGGILPLADFGQTFFSGAQATLNGQSGPIDDSAWQADPITMTDSSGNVTKAYPSGLTDSNGASSFNVTWKNN